MMPKAGSRSPTNHPITTEPPTPTTVTPDRLPHFSFSIRSLLDAPITRPIIIPHTKLNTAHFPIRLSRNLFMSVSTLAAEVDHRSAPASCIHRFHPIAYLPRLAMLPYLAVLDSHLCATSQ